MPSDAEKIESLKPDGDADEVARLCLLMINAVGHASELADDEVFQRAWQDTGLKLQASADQHAAMTQELVDLAASNPDDFSQDQIWVLIRAIKVQSQVLQMYVGTPVLDV